MMAEPWPAERRKAFRNDAIVRLAALNRAAAEGQNSPASAVEFGDPAMIPSLVPNWPPGPIVVIGVTGEFEELPDLSQVPADWRSSVHVIAALDLYWWVQQKQPGKLHLTRLEPDASRRAASSAYRNGG